MNTNDKIAEPKTGTSMLVRPRYAPGQMLQDDDLTQAVNYTRDLNRLLFRSLLGCGVICGLIVKAETKCGDKLEITIAAGVALDCAGDPLQVTAVQSFLLDPCCKPLPASLCVVIRHRDCNCQPRASACGSDGEGSGATRINDGYELRVIGDCPECGCGCATRVTPPQANPPPVVVLAKNAKQGAAPSIKASATATTPAPAMAPDCQCVDPTNPCYAGHYKAVCSCCTDCEWLTLARVVQTSKAGATPVTWDVDHSVRRLIRPVLMRDVLAEDDVGRIKLPG